MTEKRSRVHYIDTDREGKLLISDSQVLGKSGRTANFKDRLPKNASVADLFAEKKVMERPPDYSKKRNEDMALSSLRLNYASSLASVMSEKAHNAGETINPEFEESDLDHALELLKRVNSAKD